MIMQNSIKWKMNFKKFVSKINDIIKLDFDIDNILTNKKSHKNILICDISYKTLIGPNSLHIRFDKIDGFTRIMMELDI